MPPRAAFGNAVEFTTEEELRNLALDLDAMRVQCLLICERVLGPHHKDTLFRLMYRLVRFNSNEKEMKSCAKEYFTTYRMFL